MGIMTSSDFAALVAALVSRTGATSAEMWAFLFRPRPCNGCHRTFTPHEQASYQLLYGPHWHIRGLDTTCAACWLGVGPNDIDVAGGRLD